MPEQRTPLEIAADPYRCAIADRAALEAELERLQLELDAASKRVVEADHRVREARRHLIEAAELPIIKIVPQETP